MKVSKIQPDALNYQLTIEIAAADYAEPLRKRLNEYKRKADIKGFRFIDVGSTATWWVDLALIFVGSMAMVALYPLEPHSASVWRSSPVRKRERTGFGPAQ